MNLKPAIYGRPLSRYYAAKRVADAVFAQSATLLDAWAFDHDLVVTRSALGSVQRGYFEVVQVFGTQNRTTADDDVLALLREDSGLRQAARSHVDAQPGGFEALIVESGESCLPGDDLLTCAQREYLPLDRAVRQWECPLGPDAAPLGFRSRADVPQGEPSVVGLMWPVGGSLSLRSLVALRLAELLLGSDEQDSVLHPLRERGEVYTAFARYLYDIGVFVVCAAGAYSPAMERELPELLAGLGERPWLNMHFAQAKRLYAARLRMAETVTPMYSLATYMLIEPSVTVEQLVNLADQVSPEEVTHFLNSDSIPLRQKAAGHGLF